MNSDDILEDINRIMQETKNSDYSCISIDEIRKLFKTIKQNYEDTRRVYTEKFQSILQSKLLLTKPYCCNVKGFDYVNQVLQFEFNFWGRKNVNFRKKNNGELYLITESLYASEILNLLGSDLSILYDEFMKYKNFYTQHHFNFYPINSSFLVDISSDGFFVQAKGLKLYSYNSFTNWECSCNSQLISNAIRGKEEEISQRLFVKIEDCPLWSHQILYEIRQEQIKEQQRLEEKSRRKLEFKEKFFLG